jgi:hypothetical protein
MIDDSGLLPDDFAGGKDGKVGDAADGVSRSELLVAIRVDLEDDSLTRHLFCRTGNLRSRSAARSAPVRPEVDKNRNPGTLDNLIEEFSINWQRFVKRRQRSFARAASACIRKMICSESVFLTTALTGSYRRHSLLPEIAPDRLD